MGNPISNSALSRFIISCTLGTFIFTTITPLETIPKAPGLNVNLNDI
jgi:hypothetical protein